MFKLFGLIKSCVVLLNNIRKFAFVCYEDPIKKEYGPECVQKAIDETNGKYIEGSELNLVVKHSLWEFQSEVEKEREAIRYK